MSYILDALRRAEAERQRGQVPGLGAAMAPLPASDTLPLARRPVWWLVVLLAALGLAAGVGWWWAREPAPAAPSMSGAPAASAARAVDAAPALAPTSPPPTLPVVVSAPAAPPPTEAAGGVEPRPGAALAPPASPRTAASAAASDAPTVRLAELSPQQRSEWPPLAFGGSVWSDSSASRFVIIDGQVLHEGQTVRPGLVLERIGPKAAWLRWRGLRVEVPL